MTRRIVVEAPIASRTPVAAVPTSKFRMVVPPRLRTQLPRNHPPLLPTGRVRAMIWRFRAIALVASIAILFIQRSSFSTLSYPNQALLRPNTAVRLPRPPLDPASTIRAFIVAPCPTLRILRPRSNPRSSRRRTWRVLRERRLRKSLHLRFRITLPRRRLTKPPTFAKVNRP